MNQAYKLKIDTVKALRQFFADRGATEVFTPITRRTSSASMQRVRTEFGTYLRNCQELQLRLMMEYYGDVFEIGSNFRLEEDDDATHGREFTLLEAQFAGRDLSFLMGLLRDIVSSLRGDSFFEVISVAETIKERTGIDIVTSGEMALVSHLKTLYPTLSFAQNFQIINYYISQEIEPMSTGRCVFFTDYPACTLSLARYDIASKEIVRRFEFFINGIEVSNGYENSLDIDEFVERNKKVDMFTAEEQYLETALRSGRIPTDTSIIGIGIERLCMALYGISDIRYLVRENPVF